MTFSPDGKALAAPNWDRTVRLWDVSTRTLLGGPFTGHSDLVTSVRFSPDGRLLATGSYDQSVRVWDVASRTQLHEPIEHDSYVQDIAFSPDGRILASASWDKTVRLWDVPRWAPLASLEHPDRVNSVTFSPDGRILATASRDKSIRLWNVETSRQVGEPLTGDTEEVERLAFSPDGATIATVGDRGDVGLWDLGSKRLLGWLRSSPLRGFAHDLAFSPDGSWVATGTGSTVLLFDIRTNSWADQACRIANRNLSHAEWEQLVGSDQPYQPTCPQFPMPSSADAVSTSSVARAATTPPALETNTPLITRATPGPTSAATAAAATTTTASGPRLRDYGLSSAELYTAYRAILDKYMDPVDDRQLVKAAADSLQELLQSLPSRFPTAQLQPASGLTGNPDKDWQAFGDAYDSAVNRLPQWAQQAHPEWVVLRSMADSLHDNQTSFMTPDVARRHADASLVGIGVLVSRPDETQPPLIAKIFPNSPSATSGLKRGDRVIGVDGQDVSRQAVGDIADLIRGQPGTEVRIQVSRFDTAQPIDFTVERAPVHVDQVIGRRVPNAPIGYLKIRSFGDASMVDQVLGILDQGRLTGIRGWIVDLRGNPGGSQNAVLGAAAGFFDANHTTLGYLVDRLRHQTPLTVSPQNILNGAPLVVLVDRNTASGAEIFAAALQDGQAATLVGGKTAGNVGVATQITLADGSVLQVTEQRFVSLSGAHIDGVTPDVVVKMTDDDLRNDRDPQLNLAKRSS